MAKGSNRGYWASEKRKEVIERKKAERESKIREVVKDAIEDESYGTIVQVVEELRRRYPEFKDKSDDLLASYIRRIDLYPELKQVIEDRKASADIPGLVEHAKKLIKKNPWAFESYVDLAKRVNERFPEAKIGGIVYQIKTKGDQSLFHYMTLGSLGKDKVIKDALDVVKGHEEIKGFSQLAKFLVKNHPDYEGLKWQIVEDALKKHDDVELLLNVMDKKGPKTRAGVLAEKLISELLDMEERTGWSKKNEPKPILAKEYEAYGSIVEYALYPYLNKLRNRGFTPEERMERLIALGIPPADAEDIVTEEPIKRLEDYETTPFYKKKKKSKHK